MKLRDSRLRHRLATKRTMPAPTQADHARDLVIGLRVRDRRDQLWSAIKLMPVLRILIECGITEDAEIMRWAYHLREQGHPLLTRISDLDHRVHRVLEVIEQIAIEE